MAGRKIKYPERENRRINDNTYRILRILKRKCITCGNDLSLKWKKQRCESCTLDMSILQRKYRKRQKKLGLCIAGLGCKEKATCGVYCLLHYQKRVKHRSGND